MTTATRLTAIGRPLPICEVAFQPPSRVLQGAQADHERRALACPYVLPTSDDPTPSIASVVASPSAKEVALQHWKFVSRLLCACRA